LARSLRFKADWKIWSNPMPSKHAGQDRQLLQRAEERKNIYERAVSSPPWPPLALPASRITLFLNTQNGDGKAGPMCWSLLDFHDTRSYWQGRRGIWGARQGQVRPLGDRSEWQAVWHPGLAVFVSPELPEENSFSSTSGRLAFSCPTRDCRVGKEGILSYTGT